MTLVFLGLCVGTFLRSPYETRVGVVRHQPVPFSHQQHVGILGLDCRLCHMTVETSAFAGMPPVKTCMNCHSQIWKDSPVLEPVRSAFASGRPLAWTRVHDLPDFVHFDHRIHVVRGIGCTTCHGRVDRMPLLWRESSLDMKSCLSCHRDPARYMRPLDKVFALDWEPGHSPPTTTPVAIDRSQITNCSVCHY